MRKALIDAGIYALAMKGDDTVVRTLRNIDRIGLSATSVSELLTGFKDLANEADNRKDLDRFMDSPRVMVHPIDVETADFFASLLHSLKAAGTPLPTNVIWLSAVALQHGYKIYSKEATFTQIPGLVSL
jgi:tRNA(fMet)-specific endonuclease VapC